MYNWEQLKKKTKKEGNYLGEKKGPASNTVEGKRSATENFIELRAGPTSPMGYWIYLWREPKRDQREEFGVAGGHRKRKKTTKGVKKIEKIVLGRLQKFPRKVKNGGPSCGKENAKKRCLGCVAKGNGILSRDAAVGSSLEGE